MAVQADPPSSGCDWDSMTQNEKVKIEQKLDEILEMMRIRFASPSMASTTPSAVTSICHRDLVAVALAPAFGGPACAPHSSATSSSSSCILDTGRVVALDATDLEALTPTGCSTEGLSSDASESRSPTDPATAPTASSATVDIISVLAATAASDGALDGDAFSGVTSMPGTCSTHVLRQGIREDSPVAVSLVLETTSPLWPSSAFEFGISVPPMCLMKIYVEVTSKLTPATALSDVSDPSRGIVASDNNSYAESTAPRLAGTLSTVTPEWTWLMHASSRPPAPDAWDCTGGVFSPWRPLLPAPIPKPPWLLLGHEQICAYMRCDLQKPTTYLNLDAICNSFLCMVTQRTSRTTRLMLCLNMLNPLACLRILVSSTISLQSWFGSVIESAHNRSSFLQHTTEWLTSSWDPAQQVIDDNDLPVLDSSFPMSLRFEKSQDITGAVHEWNLWLNWQSYLLHHIERSCCCDKMTLENSSHGTAEHNQPGYAGALDCFLEISSLAIPGCVGLLLSWTEAMVRYLRCSFTIPGWFSLEGVFSSVSEHFHWLMAKLYNPFILHRKISWLFDLKYSKGGNMSRQPFSDILSEQYHWQIAWSTEVNISGNEIDTPLHKHVTVHGPACTVASDVQSFAGHNKVTISSSELAAEVIYMIIMDAVKIREIILFFVPGYWSGNSGCLQWDPGGICNAATWLVGGQVMFNQSVATRAKPVELFLGDGASARYCLELIQFVVATCHEKIVSSQNVMFGLLIHLKQSLGLWLFDLEPWNLGGKTVMARATCFVDFAGHHYYSDAFPNKIHVVHDNYLAFTNKISVGYNYYLDQVYYFDTICGDLKCYHEDYHEDCNKLKVVHAPWDPGKSALQYPSKTSAWGQADFQEGRNVMTLAYVPQVGPFSWASDDGLGPTDQPRANATTYTHGETTKKLSSWITNRTAALIPPLCSSLPLPPIL